MGEEATKPTLGKPSSSFRLRSPSLNTLRLRRIFDVFDKNSDGLITIQELNLALEQLGLETDLSEIESTVKSYIKEDNEGLEFDDFESLHQNLGNKFFGSEEIDDDYELSELVEQEEADLVEAFKVFDEDGDGFISAKELQVVLEKLGLPEGKEIERVREMIISVDENHDGSVDFLEFKNMMKGVVLQQQQPS